VSAARQRIANVDTIPDYFSLVRSATPDLVSVASLSDTSPENSARLSGDVNRVAQRSKARRAQSADYAKLLMLGGK
jgi:hypothetical protein